MVIEQEQLQIKIEMSENLTQFSKDAWRKFKTFLGNFFELYARDLKKRMKDSMRKTEEAPWLYWNGGKGRWVHPSKPGMPPKIQTGNLARSIQWANRRRVPELEFGVTSDAFYALFLEKGTSKMAPRPFFYRLIDQRKVQEDLKTAYEEFLNEEASKKGTTL